MYFDISPRETRVLKAGWQNLLPHQRDGIGAVGNAAPRVAVELLETPRRPARRQQHDFVAVDLPLYEIQSRNRGIAAGLDLQHHAVLRRLSPERQLAQP